MKLLNKIIKYYLKQQIKNMEINKAELNKNK